jgi:hypothetical protein
MQAVPGLTLVCDCANVGARGAQESRLAADWLRSAYSVP